MLWFELVVAVATCELDTSAVRLKTGMVPVMTRPKP